MAVPVPGKLCYFGWVDGLPLSCTSILFLVSSLLRIACTRCRLATQGAHIMFVQVNRACFLFGKGRRDATVQPAPAPPLVPADPTAGCNPTRQWQPDARTEARVSRGGR
jgi:hypothetical protein